MGLSTPLALYLYGTGAASPRAEVKTMISRVLDSQMVLRLHQNEQNSVQFVFLRKQGAALNAFFKPPSTHHIFELRFYRWAGAPVGGPSRLGTGGLKPPGGTAGWSLIGFRSQGLVGLRIMWVAIFVAEGRGW